MRVPVVVRVGVFAVLVMGSYAMFANSIPQIESKPPQELSLEGGNVTPAQLVKAGEEIFHTKGTCEICHRIGQKGTRAPDLAGADAREIRRPGALLTDPVADLARALSLEDLLAGLHELRGRDIAALERQLGRRLRLNLRDRIRVVRVRAHHKERKRADLDADRKTHG